MLSFECIKNEKGVYFLLTSAILNKMGRENSQTAQFWQIFSAYNSYNAYDVEVKRYFDLNDIELLRTACSHNSQKHS